MKRFRQAYFGLAPHPPADTLMVLKKQPSVMKKCTHCGRENGDEAEQCSACGTPLEAIPADTVVPATWDRIAVLSHEVEAERLEIELNNRNIPHEMVSYGDTAFDGLFQMSRGWGHVEAPREHKEAILSVLKDIRQERRAEPENEED